MLARREFAVRANVKGSLLATIAAFLVSLCALAFIGLGSPGLVVDERTAAEFGFLRAFGVGLVVSGAIAVYLIARLLKLRKSKGTTLVLDEQVLQYGGIRVSWPTMREAVVCKSLGRRFVGIRTINDRAMQAKMNQAFGSRISSVVLLVFNYMQWRTQCSVLLFGVRDITTEELCKLIEEYRIAFSGVVSGDDANSRRR